MIINPELAKFAFALEAAYSKACEEAPEEFWSLFNPVSVKLYTGDGLTAEFYEEGVDFYPSKKENN